jgi:hypothetical protein
VSCRRAANRRVPLGAHREEPAHFTLAFDDLELGIEELRRCDHRSWVNPYPED